MKKKETANKGFLYQILVETKKLFTSKFMIIMIALILLLSIVFPIIGKVNANKKDKDFYYDRGMDDLVFDGDVISADNPQFWELRDLDQEIKHLKEYATTSADDLQLDYLQILFDCTLKTAKEIKTHEDYRHNLTWRLSQLYSEKFIFDNLDKKKEDLMQAIQYRRGMDPETFDKEYLKLTNIEVMQKLDKINENIANINKIIDENDYKQYYQYEIDRQNDNHKENLERIKTLENDILENPKNEEMYSEQIEGIKKSNIRILEISIPAFEYKLENSIIPNSDDWREEAVDQKRNAQSDLLYSEIKSQEDFEKEEYLKEEYKNYQNYKKAMEKEIDNTTKRLYIADKSLESNKPDMRYVPKGSRKKVVNFLWYSMVIAVFSVIIGGGLIAREFQSGTIRLLLIRPKTRTKILMSKFLSLLIISFALYLVCAILNLITNGILFGFSDYMYPNYTISSGVHGVNFFGYFVSKLMICFITVLFACSVAFFLSVATRNTALSVAIPLACFLGSHIAMEFVQYRPSMQWVVYTPLLYINLSSFFINDITRYAGNRIQPILGLGIPMMIALSIICIVISIVICRKKDVTN
jgi:ABC-2 type transport system permease protein